MEGTNKELPSENYQLRDTFPVRLMVVVVNTWWINKTGLLIKWEDKLFFSIYSHCVNIIKEDQCTSITYWHRTIKVEASTTCSYNCRCPGQWNARHEPKHHLPLWTLDKRSHQSAACGNLISPCLTLPHFQLSLSLFLELATLQLLQA